MRARSWFAILAVIILAAFTIAVQAGAETIKGRLVQFIAKAEVIQVGDVPDHIIGVYDQTGLASFDTGEVASLALKGTLDYIKGSGPIQGIYHLHLRRWVHHSQQVAGRRACRPDGKGFEV